MTIETTYRDRAYTDTDLQAVCDLLNLCDAVDKLDDNYDLEDLRLEFADPRLDPPRDLRLWEDAASRLVGFGQVWMPKTPDPGEAAITPGFYWRVHPDARHSGIEDEMIAWAETRAREVGRERGLSARLGGWAREGYAYQREIMEQRGFAVVRYFFRMACLLGQPIPDMPLPDGFTLRHVDGPKDVAGWVEAFNQSFIDHWNHHPMTLEAHQHYLTGSWYRPEHDLIAVAPDGTIAAFCFCQINPADNQRNNRNEGWIDMLGTRRGYRKLGLGRAMLLAGLRRLKADGMDTAVLGVDAENPTGALRLYESVGFVTDQRSVAYRKTL